MEALQLVDQLQRSAQQSELRRIEAEQQVEELKSECMELAQQLKESMDNTDMLAQIQELQQAVLEYQNKYDEMKKKKRESVFSQTHEDLKTQVADLSKCLEELKEENDRLKKEKSPDLTQFHTEIDNLQQAVLDYQEKCDFLRKQNAELVREAQKRSKQNAAAKLNEKIQNLTFQLFYGTSSKDKEISQLTEKVEAYDADSTQVDKMKKKMAKMRDKTIEEWLFVGDANEAL